MLRAAGAVGAVSLLAIAVAGSPATASPSSDKQGDEVVITMNRDGKKLFFEGPETVAPGQTLTIENRTNPRVVGPHTFSLVGEKTLPKGRKEIRKCERQFEGICGAIAKWHKVDVDTGQVGRNPVKAGEDGWDRAGNLKRTGDSWVSQKKKGETFSQEVSAADGKVLNFICAVHASMQGQIRVEG
jgi:hypothetical protein